MIYPRLSPTGERVAYGNEGVFIDGIAIRPIPGDLRSFGTSPVWADERTIYYTYSRPGHRDDGELVRYFIGEDYPTFVGLPSGNILTAGGARWATWRPDAGVQTSDGESYPTNHSPAMSDNGTLIFGKHEDGTSNYAWGGTTVARQNGYRLTIEVIVDYSNPNSVWDTLDIELGCAKPIPVWTGRLLFILFHTHDGCVFLMEYGSKLGYVIRPRDWDGGSGYTHDARPLSQDLIRVVSPHFDQVIDLTLPRVELPPSENTVPIPVPPMSCTPVVPTQDIIKASTDNIRNFCQTFQAPDGSYPYMNDEIHENGLFLSDGLLYFMMSDTGLWAKVLMNPDDKTPWPEKRIKADNALFDYMRARFQ